MEITSFYQLDVADYNLFHLFAMHQKWDNQKVITIQNRKSSGLLYLEHCAASYRLADHSHMLAPRGSVLFLPQGSSYQCTFLAQSGEKARCHLVEFALRTLDGQGFSVYDQVTVVGSDENPLVPELFTEAVETYSRPRFSPPVFKAVVYQLIARLASQDRQQTIHTQQLAGIQPALAYLEKNHLPENGISQLAQMCHMSEVSFRKKFRQYAGMAPSAYILRQKLQRAKRLLRSGIYSVAETAEAVGFEDASYFSKVFKKHTGKSPSSFLKETAVDPIDEFVKKYSFCDYE